MPLAVQLTVSVHRNRLSLCVGVCGLAAAIQIYTKRSYCICLGMDARGGYVCFLLLLHQPTVTKT